MLVSSLQQEPVIRCLTSQLCLDLDSISPIPHGVWSHLYVKLPIPPVWALSVSPATSCSKTYNLDQLDAARSIRSTAIVSLVRPIPGRLPDLNALSGEAFS